MGIIRFNRSASLTTVFVTLVVGALMAPPPVAQAAPGEVRLMAVGDMGTTGESHANVQLAQARGATGLVGLGDYWYWSDPSEWKAMVDDFDEHHLVVGNHDSKGTLQELGYLPEGSVWVEDVNGVRIVGTNSVTYRHDPGSYPYETLEAWLRDAPGDVILVAHHNWWLGEDARHPGSEWRGPNDAMRDLVRSTGVDLVLVAHEHNYQRAIIDGVPHVIVGTGGQSEYPLAGTHPNTVATHKGTGFLELDLAPDGVEARFVALDGSERDAFTTREHFEDQEASAERAGSFEARFWNERGNDWWVETDVEVLDGGSISHVTATVNGHEHELERTSWGSWADVVRAPDGSTVTFHAYSTQGARDNSATFQWGEEGPIGSA